MLRKIPISIQILDVVTTQIEVNRFMKSAQVNSRLHFRKMMKLCTFVQLLADIVALICADPAMSAVVRGCGPLTQTVNNPTLQG